MLLLVLIVLWEVGLINRAALEVRSVALVSIEVLRCADRQITVVNQIPCEVAACRESP